MVPLGLEPRLIANLANRVYKTRRASYYTIEPIFIKCRPYLTEAVSFSLGLQIFLARFLEELLLNSEHVG